MITNDWHLSPSRTARTCAVLAVLAAFTPAELHAQPKPQPKTPAPATPSASASQVPVAPPPATGTAPGDEATALFKQGIAAHDAGKLVEAEQLFSKAWALKKTWDIAANLGLVESRLGKHARAAEHLAYAARLVPPTEPAATAAEIRKRLDVERAEVGAVTLHVNVDGAAVRVDGDLVGTTPIEREVFAGPGSVTIEVSKDGYDPARTTLDVAKGGTATPSLTLVPTAAPERSKLPAAVAFGVGGAGLLVGAITGALSLAKFGDLKAACGGDFSCTPAHRGDADTGRALGDASTAAFVVAGVAAAAGVTLLVVPLGRPAPARTSLAVGPGFVGVKGAF